MSSRYTTWWPEQPLSFVLQVGQFDCLLKLFLRQLIQKTWPHFVDATVSLPKILKQSGQRIRTNLPDFGHVQLFTWRNRFTLKYILQLHCLNAGWGLYRMFCKKSKLLHISHQEDESFILWKFINISKDPFVLRKSRLVNRTYANLPLPIWTFC